ncbi:hypothetical protein SCLCIDRAFT_140112 [Scleroderma citrinum Foug A]|uniref:FAD/NAD(P)-binding domain-containing protein n=1 Tax=Scleroderma citrinum Foug A TaxID=1036808 RepID=A0A0C2ZJJ7_9AGAM|nr:hypothetical protein SCLCIDRAFT_140112 [Scleroderma citrinum Foug A]
MAVVQAPARSLPTLQRLGSTVDPNIDVQAVVKSWFTCFADAMSSKDVAGILDLIVDDAFWRDMLALTWDFHTYEGKDSVKQFLTDQLPKFDLSAFKLREELVSLDRPYEDLVWIQGIFNFDTTVGHATGIFRLVPLPDGSWKAHSVYTNLDDLRDFPEKTGSLRNHEPNHGKWAEGREREQEFLDKEPGVLIIGGGQSGLDVAARLKMLGINSLIVERHDRIGDNWRTRYAAMCLHDTVWYDHLPHLPFPPSWPVYTPALKMANWLESYAQSLELNVWTSATVLSVEPSTKGKRWSVRVVRGDGRERVFEVNHVVFATGFGNGKPRIPNIPGQEEFKGQILHSSQHNLAIDHLGKKVAVVGACTSAHDICSDYVEHGIDVTMVQRGPTYVMSTKEGVTRVIGALYKEDGPPTDLADRINASFPNHFLRLLHQHVTQDIAEADKDILDGLRKVGFKLTFGEDGAGFMALLWEKLGGYYFDVGASQRIIDGEIKLKSDGPIARFTSTGLLFEDGSTLGADVVLFATGYGDATENYLRLLPENLHDAVKPAWGLNEEGETPALWREIGGRGPESKKLAGLWSILGNLALCRFHSKHIAMQIKAYEEGIFGERY